MKRTPRQPGTLSASLARRAAPLALACLLAALSAASAAQAEAMPAGEESPAGPSEGTEADNPARETLDSLPRVPVGQTLNETVDAGEGLDDWFDDQWRDLKRDFLPPGVAIQDPTRPSAVRYESSIDPLEDEGYPWHLWSNGSASPPSPEGPAAEAPAPPEPGGPASSLWTDPEAEASAAEQQQPPCLCLPKADPPLRPGVGTEAAVRAADPLPAAVQAGAAVVVGVLLWHLLAGLLVRQRPELHPRAQLILRTVCENPGLTFRGIREATGLANGVALHHLDRLSEGGHIVAHRHLNTLRFFENHGRYGATWRQVTVLRDRLNERLHRWLAANPGATQADVLAGSQEWGWRRGLTRKRLALLEQAGLLARTREGRVVRHAALPPLEPLPRLPSSPTADAGLLAWEAPRAVEGMGLAEKV